MKQTSTRRNKNWLRNPNQRKRPKVFTAKFVQQTDGSLLMLGGQTMVLERKNQYSGQWVNVDTRDFATELRQNKIVAL